MSKDTIYQNIRKMLENGFFQKMYIERTKDINIENVDGEELLRTVGVLENISANIFNAIIIACQLFDSKEQIKQFVELFPGEIDSFALEFYLPRKFNMPVKEAMERLRNGFGIHFTTTKICEEIMRKGKLAGFGNNAMFTKEEDEIIKKASEYQIQNDPAAEKKLNYLFRGWGTGVSSYSTITNGFWMYHTPESLSFLFGNISLRDKEKAMKCVLNRISTLPEEDKIKVFNVMSNIWDRLIGNDSMVCCILIDRDAFEYEKDSYYANGEVVTVERRPFSKTLNDINNNDCKINKDIDVANLRFLKVPNIFQLEAIKKRFLQSGEEHTRKM